MPATWRRHAPAPSQKPSVPQLDTADAEQSLRGFDPGSANAHVPRLLGAAQVWQVPPHAVLQQTPSTQNPLMQSPPTAQAVPLFSCGTQWPAAQWLPAVQSAFDPQLVAHDAAPHMYAPQSEVAGVWQTPAPLQVLAGVNVVPLHIAAAQTVPATHRRQAPPPSQKPSRPQLDGRSAVHSLSGSVPPTTGRHSPSACAVLAFEHAEQLPAHADSQQMPSTQLPLVHSAPLRHVAPWPFTVPHTVPRQ